MQTQVHLNIGSSQYQNFTGNSDRCHSKYGRLFELHNSMLTNRFQIISANNNSFKNKDKRCNGLHVIWPYSHTHDHVHTIVIQKCDRIRTQNIRFKNDLVCQFQQTSNSNNILSPNEKNYQLIKAIILITGPNIILFE